MARLRYLDYFLLIPYLILCGVGVVMVYSASADQLMMNNQSPQLYLNKQMLYVTLSFLLIAVMLSIGWKQINDSAMIGLLMLITYILLFYLVVLKYVHPSSAVNGATGWIALGGFNVQPVEIAKLTLILYLAHVLAKHGHEYSQLKFWGYVKATRKQLVCIALMLAMVLIQPDLGGMAILAFIVLIVWISSGISVRYSVTTLFGTIGIIIGLVFAVIKLKPSFLTSSYKFSRLMSFLHPFQLENKGGAQLVNSYYAINNGSWFGVGLGNSIQKRGYLPEPYTDFILSITTEELGLVGALIILALLFFLIFRIMLIGIRAKSAYRSLICYGVAAWLFVQTLFNVGGMSGILPITGVTLPFISYGGSSMLMLAIALGLVFDVAADEKREQRTPKPVQLKKEEEAHV
ncbi:FtsW/RodA/SpoVE family cell cycle protein [Lactobacillus selangorensis]|nr:FtsW/RodA/SpoVE family cell cycle protein [Lactobacillus selangorensis]